MLHAYAVALARVLHAYAGSLGQCAACTCSCMGVCCMHTQLHWLACCMHMWLRGPVMHMRLHGPVCCMRVDCKCMHMRSNQGQTSPLQTRRSSSPPPGNPWRSAPCRSCLESRQSGPGLRYTPPPVSPQREETLVDGEGLTRAQESSIPPPTHPHRRPLQCGLCWRPGHCSTGGEIGCQGGAGVEGRTGRCAGRAGVGSAGCAEVPASAWHPSPAGTPLLQSPRGHPAHFFDQRPCCCYGGVVMTVVRRIGSGWAPEPLEKGGPEKGESKASPTCCGLVETRGDPSSPRQRLRH